jgi:hypothetical protein
MSYKVTMRALIIKKFFGSLTFVYICCLNKILTMKKLFTVITLFLASICYCQNGYIQTKNGEKIDIKIERFIERTVDVFEYTLPNYRKKKIDLAEVEKVVHGNAEYKPFVREYKKKTELQLFKVIAVNSNKTLLASFNRATAKDPAAASSDPDPFFTTHVIVYFCVADENNNLLETGNINKSYRKKKVLEIEAEAASKIKKHFGDCEDLVDSLSMRLAIDKEGFSTPQTNFFMQDKVFQCD